MKRQSYAISLPLYCQPGFLAHAAALARPAARVIPHGNTLQLTGLPAAAIAEALAFGAFPVWEKQALSQLIRREFSLFPEEIQKNLLAAALWRLANDPMRCELFAGPGREARLIAELLPLLLSGSFDLIGFCRFRLQEYTSYLRFLLDLAADDLLAAEEEASYFALLQRAAQRTKNSPLLCVFLSSDAVYHIWQSNATGIRLLEGGSLLNGEAMLTAVLIASRPRQLILRGEAIPTALVARLAAIFGKRLRVEAAGLTKSQTDDTMNQY